VGRRKCAEEVVSGSAAFGWKLSINEQEVNGWPLARTLDFAPKALDSILDDLASTEDHS
jgi:hypothetical protein